MVAVRLSLARFAQKSVNRNLSIIIRASFGSNRGVRRAVTGRAARTDTAPPQQARLEQENEPTDLIEWSGSGRGTEIYHLGFFRAG